VIGRAGASRTRQATGADSRDSVPEFLEQEKPMVSCSRGRAWFTATGVAALVALAFAPVRPLHSLLARGDEPVPMKDVPEAVRATATKQFGALDACKASKEKEHGRIRWEIEKPTDGGAVESLVISDAGDLMVVEKPIAADKLPKAVRDALAAAFPKATLGTAETIEERALEVVINVDGKKKHVKVELDGAIPSAHAAAKPAESKEHAAKKAGEKEEEEDGEEEDEDDEGGGR
jgi:hypothetical protein